MGGFCFFLMGSSFSEVITNQPVQILIVLFKLVHEFVMTLLSQRVYDALVFILPLQPAGAETKVNESFQYALFT
jgi:hypothetical protein